MLNYEKPLISIVVPVFNCEAYLDRCITSILKQTYRNIELILVNDGSTDSSGDICDNYALSDNRVFVIHQENGGASAARNRGILESKGEYIAFVDSDDWIANTMYEKLIGICLHENASIACCGRYNVDEQTLYESEGLCPEKNCSITASEMISKMLTWDGVDIALWDKLFVKELWNGIELPLGEINEEVEVLLQLFKNADLIALVSERLYYYLQREDSITHSKFNKSKFDCIKHSKKLIREIEEVFPQVVGSAYYYYYYELLYTYNELLCQDKKVQLQYKNEKNMIKTELKNQELYNNITKDDFLLSVIYRLNRLGMYVLCYNGRKLIKKLF